MPKTQQTVPVQEAGPDRALTKAREDVAQLLAETLRRVCGVKTPEVAYALASQVANLQVWTRPDPEEPVDALMRATHLLLELAPKTGAEALLSVQMLGVHEAATAFLRQATVEDQTVDGADRNVLRATRLMRLFTEQLDAMAKLKGRTSQQRVTVEHVHVYRGGQAIVGAVNATKPAPRDERDPDADPDTT